MSSIFFLFFFLLVGQTSKRFFMITEGFFIQYHRLSKTPRRVTCLIGANVKAVDHWASSGVFRKKKKKVPGFILQVGGYPFVSYSSLFLFIVPSPLQFFYYRRWRRLFTTSSRAHAKEWVHAVRANAKGYYCNNV